MSWGGLLLGLTLLLLLLLLLFGFGLAVFGGNCLAIIRLQLLVRLLVSLGFRGVSDIRVAGTLSRFWEVDDFLKTAREYSIQ